MIICQHDCYINIIVMKEEFQLHRLLDKAELIHGRDGPLQQRKRIIQSLNETRKKRLNDAQKQLEERQIQLEVEVHEDLYIEGKSIEKDKRKRNGRKKSTTPRKEVKKNEGVSDIDKMVFEKNFKNYINHKEQFAEKARRRREAIIQKRKKQAQIDDADDYFNEDEILSNTGSDYQYRDADDMKIAYDTIATGKRRKKGVQLFHAEKFQFAFKFAQFQMLLGLMENSSEGLISKDLFLNYLFDEPMVMMLYSINPYVLGDQISEFETKINGMLSFEQFSSFLLIDREPTYFDYSAENIAEARKIGRGLKCAPIVGKWIDATGIYEFLMDIFDGVDMFGKNEAERSVLAKKVKREAELKRLMDVEVIEIVNINKTLPLNRIIYEIEHEMASQEKWTREKFENFLQHYHRLQTPEIDKLITKLIMSGNYDPSYIYIVSQEVIDLIKSVFEEMQKFAQFFVLKEKFVNKFCSNPKYKKVKDFNVRSETNRYVVKETVEETLARFLNEADAYVDLEQILEFFTNRGRPRIIEYQVYIANLERQLAILEEEEMAKLKKMEELGQDYLSTSSDEEFDQVVRNRTLQRKKKKLEDIHRNMKYNPKKKFNVTIPMPFLFDVRDKSKKVTIRERRVKEMVEEKREKENEAMQPIKPKEVPKHVKQNLFEKLMKDQERERLERLQRFRLQIKNSMVPISDRLVKPKTVQIHCDFSKEDYKFVARPMPWYCQVNLMDRINRKKEERRQKILEQIISKHQENDLPEGVLKMIERNQNLQKKRMEKNTNQSEKTKDECTFIPKISQGIPDFKALHETLDLDFQLARQEKVPLVPEPFSFENREKKARTTHLRCLEKDHRPLGHSREYIPDKRRVDIKSTEKHEALIDYRRKKNEEDIEKEEEENRNNEVRKLRQMKFAPYVRKALKKNETQIGRSRKELEDRLKDFKKEEKNKKKQYEEEMIKIYTKVWNRPLLFQTTGQFGENEIKMNPRYSQDKKHPHSKNQQYGEQRQPYEEERQQYEEKRRRAIEQPPGQYLIEGDYDEDDEDGNQENYVYEGRRFDEDDFEQQYLQNGGLRTH